MDHPAIKDTQEVIRRGIKLADGVIKNSWSIRDAAVMKKIPSEVVNQKTIKSIRGKT